MSARPAASRDAFLDDVERTLRPVDPAARYLSEHGYEHAVVDVMRHLSLPARKMLHLAAQQMEAIEDEGRTVTGLRVMSEPEPPPPQRHGVKGGA